MGDDARGSHTPLRHLLALLVLIPIPGFSQSCYESSILSPSPFLGNHGEIVKLADGTLWEVQFEYEYMYEYFPSVIVCPSRGKLIVEGKSLSVISLSPTPRRQAAPARSDFDSAKVEAAHPGWGVIVRSTEFRTWMQHQPSSLRKMAESPTADQAILILDLYKRDTQRQDK
jgi:hypothetical protein